ncbi:MAG: 3-dehydroquinate dehydratase [Bacteroidetes bacterium RIFCSPHIGHO2_02_FULL_44_7]|nr:MAG: 3-dehydroquinate dehydratase [Bacteroidetes bacterium RIFCSPHIGHO2_02_FULL_44_7]
MRIIIVNGPNLNLIGQREEEIYGSASFASYLDSLKQRKDVVIDYFQSNVEGELINCLQGSGHDGIILNAGGYTHTSVALSDCVKAIDVPVVEVHISNIAAREPFRHTSLISPGAIGCIFGFGLEGYALALDYFIHYFNRRETSVD